MRKIHLALLSTLFLCCTIGYSQDTTVYKRNPLNTCANKIVPFLVGCGHPDYVLQICDGDTLEKAEIYDRWGTLLFETSNVFEKWDLHDKNHQRLPEGDYYYKIRYKDQSGSSKTTTGNFHLIP
jgi:gliding motility-associated-like protein